MNFPALGRTCSPALFGLVPVEQVLYEFDGPRTYVGRSPSVGWVLAHLASIEEEGAWYFLAPTSTKLIEKLVEGRLAVRDALTQTWLYLALLDEDGGVRQLTQVEPERVMDFLPRPGVMLYAHLQPALTLRYQGQNLKQIPAELLQIAAQGATRAIETLASLRIRQRYGERRNWPDWASSLWNLSAQDVAFSSLKVSFSQPLAESPEQKELVQQLRTDLERAFQWVSGTAPPIDAEEEAAFTKAMEHLTPPSEGLVETLEVSGRLIRSGIKRQTRRERAVVLAGRRRVELREKAQGTDTVSQIAGSTMSEWLEVEQPFLMQLVGMGWRWVTGNLDEPSVTGRSSFRETLLESDLRRALLRLNSHPQGTPWLDEGRVGQAIGALTRTQQHGLIRVNEMVTQLLLSGVPVDGVENWDGGRNQTVRLIDWENPENNEFLAINQFRVDEPGGQARRYSVPDIVLFVNGMPLVVVECKRPITSEVSDSAITTRKEIVEGVDQLRRYANLRERIGQNEGNEALFYTNQLLIATCFEEARVGTLGSGSRHFQQWKETYPVPKSKVAEMMGKSTLSSQEILVAGLLRPSHLLDVVRHFLLFRDNDEGRRIKLVCRYQQFRAVHAAIHRLQTGPKRSPNTIDKRGGIIWHTQGSGKSLTMVFLVRKMRAIRDFQSFKIVVVTDRTDLQTQLAETALLTGESVKIVKKVSHLAPLLSNNTPDLIFAMVQKYQKGDSISNEDEEEKESSEESITFPLLNPSEDILILVDEAHRSHGSSIQIKTPPKDGEKKKPDAGLLHMNLRQALPNAAMIGFTGTPIVMGDKKKTHEIFGSFIDKYTIRQSQIDGATLPIYYEGRAQTGEIKDKNALDAAFPDLFKGYTPKELETLKQRYATRGYVLEAEKLIVEKAVDMLIHYIDHVLPNGFKAQVVAHSRRGVVRYQKALTEAHQQLIQALENNVDTLTFVRTKELASGTLSETPEMESWTVMLSTDFLIRSRKHLPLLQSLKFEGVISAGNTNEDPGWTEWTDEKKNRERIRRFKRPLGNIEDAHQSPLAFLIVKSMLLTGFDAPVEQVLYLDRVMREAELLQAIARVNRAGPAKKKLGMVVDYCGIAGHLDEALKAYYDAEDIEGALQLFNNEMKPRMEELHGAVLSLLDQRNLSLQDKEVCVQALDNIKFRVVFEAKLKQFLSALDSVLPRLEAVQFLSDAMLLVEILAEAKRRYRDGGRPAIDPEDGAKVAKLLDEYLLAKGIDVRIEPVNIMDAEFAERVQQMGSDRAKASEMEHAARHYIRLHLNEDPVYYEAFSNRLESILQDLAGQWDALVKAMRSLLEDMTQGRQQDSTGLDPKREQPFYELLKQAASKEPVISRDQQERICEVTVDLVIQIEHEASRVDFWRNAQAQKELRGDIFERLDQANIWEYSRLDELADKILELARARRTGVA